MRPLWHILERHLDEADFLLDVRADCLEAPDYTLDELASGPETRIFTHLNGLAMAGAPVVEELLAPALERETLDTSRACAATLALFEVGTTDDLARALDALDNATPGDERCVGIAHGLALSERPGLDAWLLDQLHLEGSSSRMAGLAMAAAERDIDPGLALAQLLQNQSPHVSSAAARLARNSTDTQSLALVGPLAQVHEPHVQHAAIETGLVRGLRGAWESALYWAFTERPCEFRRDALSWVAMLGDQHCQQRLLGSLTTKAIARDALWALGFGGHVEAVDAAITLLADDELGPLAGEVVVAIAGAPLDDESLWLSPAPSGEPAELPALESDLDTDLDEAPEARLSRPNPETLAAWWAVRRDHLVEAPRLLGGLPWSPDRLVAALHGASLRRRHLLSLELQIRSGGSLRVDTRSWATRQLGQLTKLNPAALTLCGGLSRTSA